MIEDLVDQFRNKGLAVDTNILLLWVVGRFDRRAITAFKRTEHFSERDYDQLVALLAFVPAIVSTQSILTEVNSFAGQMGEPRRTTLLREFSAAIQQADEKYIESALLARRTQFDAIGLTDCGLIELASAGYLVLTDDYRLANYLECLSLPAINFNHLRF